MSYKQVEQHEIKQLEQAIALAKRKQQQAELEETQIQHEESLAKLIEIVGYADTKNCTIHSLSSMKWSSIKSEDYWQVALYKQMFENPTTFPNISSVYTAAWKAAHRAYASKSHSLCHVECEVKVKEAIVTEYVSYIPENTIISCEFDSECKGWQPTSLDWTCECGKTTFVLKDITFDQVCKDVSLLFGTRESQIRKLYDAHSTNSTNVPMSTEYKSSTIAEMEARLKEIQEKKKISMFQSDHVRCEGNNLRRELQYNGYVYLLCVLQQFSSYQLIDSKNSIVAELTRESMIPRPTSTKVKETFLDRAFDKLKSLLWKKVIETGKNDASQDILSEMMSDSNPIEFVARPLEFYREMIIAELSKIQ